MNPVPENIRELLLDYQMGRLDPALREVVEQSLEAQPELRTENEQLATALAPLAFWTVPDAPRDLVASVMEAIDQAPRTIKFDPSRSSLPSGAETGLVPSLLSLREVVAVAASILIIVGVFVPSYYGVRQRSQRTMCAGQLGNVGTGLANYAADYDDQLPYAGGRPGASWLPVSPPGVESLSNTRHPYLLLKMRYVHPKQMLCPGSPHEPPMPAEECEGQEDFSSPNQIGYSWQVPIGPMRQGQLHAEFVITSDRNPYIQDGRVKPMTDPVTNSAAHGANVGQNVLHINGSVIWRRTPYCGVNQDNIWQAGQITQYSGTERPRDANDSFLISPR